jgi:hypothetical protein
VEAARAYVVERRLHAERLFAVREVEDDGREGAGDARP